MASIVIPDTSPMDLLARFRGAITDACRAYPETIHLKLMDAQGGEWWLATWDAEYSPSDPDALLGKTVVSADLDELSGKLTLGLSGGSTFEVHPAPQEAEDDPKNWNLFTPEGLVLVWGPGVRWQLGRATDPV